MPLFNGSSASSTAYLALKLRGHLGACLCRNYSSSKLLMATKISPKVARVPHRCRHYAGTITLPSPDAFLGTHGKHQSAVSPCHHDPRIFTTVHLFGYNTFMYQQRDSTETFSDTHTPTTTRSDSDHPLIVDILGVALATMMDAAPRILSAMTMMFECCTPSPQCHDHRTRASPVYPAPRPCAANKQQTK